MQKQGDRNARGSDELDRLGAAIERLTPAGVTQRPEVVTRTRAALLASYADGARERLEARPAVGRQRFTWGRAAIAGAVVLVIVLAVISTLIISNSGRDTADLRVRQGTYSVLRGGGGRVVVSKNGMEVAERDRLRTGEGAMVVITTGGGGEIRLDGGTEVALDDIDDDACRLSHTCGVVYCHAQPGERYVFTADDVRVNGTDCVFNTDYQGELTRVMVINGNVTVTVRGVGPRNVTEGNQILAGVVDDKPQMVSRKIDPAEICDEWFDANRSLDDRLD